MSKRPLILALAVLAFGQGAAPNVAYAHHSFAAFFDSEKIVTIRGKVTAFRFTNPHGTIAVAVTGEDGSVREWRAETNAPVVLMRRGWTRDAVRPGQEIAIEGWMSRDGKPYMRLRRAFDADGRLIGTAPFGQGDN